MRSGFFNSEIIGYDAENMPIFDRAEEASFFAKYFSQFISNGVFPNPSTNLQVLENSDMTVKVAVGVCYINGYMGWAEAAEILEVEESDTQARIDRIVARLDFEDRSIGLFVKKGTASGNPVAPDIQRDYDIYEIALADIRVNANVIEITQANITDLRLNTEVCGIVANQLQHVDTTTLFNQYQTWLTETTGQAEIDLEAIKQDFEEYVETSKTTFNQWMENFKSSKSEEFNAWFQTIQDILDSDTAGHLLNLIEANTESINANTEDISDMQEIVDNHTEDISNLQENKADNKKNWNIALDTTWTETLVYELTEDVAIDSEKTYYTLEDGVYIEVDEPVVEDIATYYEITGTTTPYTKTVEVEGIKETDIVNMYPIYSDTLETRLAEKDEYNKISMIHSANGSVTITCDEEAPEMALNVRLEVLY